jgi:hypothetical protein
MPDKEEDGHTQGHFFVFLFRLFHFHLFTTNVIRALPLGTIKGEAGVTSRGPLEKNTPHRPRTQAHTHTHTHRQRDWDPLPLSKAYNPYYEHSGARQYEQQ